MNINKVAVIGAGTMGNGIAHVFAASGLQVFLSDIKEEYLDRALSTITKNMDRQIKKGIISEDDKSKALSNIVKTIGVESIPADCDLAIEAVSENREIKLSVVKSLNAILKPPAIIASNTSSISITELSANCRADQFIGMHFMNPVPVMKLVEIIKGYNTSKETLETVIKIAERIGKTPVEVNDYPGFISNRVLLPMINEAIFAYYEHVAKVKEIDTVMKLGMNHPMGPLTLEDFIGLDVCLDILNVLYEGFNDPKYRPCPLLKKMVAAGKLGRKTGEGFYLYEK